MAYFPLFINLKDEPVLLIGGGKVWADADNIVKIIKNTYEFVEKYISPNAPARKEHIGYIIDRVGFEKFKEYALKDVEMMPETSS